jgi:hypothetical protein
VDQVERGGARRQAADGGPQVDDVALGRAGGVEALIDVVVQAHAEGAAAGVTAVDRTGAAPLRAGAFQPGGQAEVVEDAGDRQLLLEMGEVDRAALAASGRWGYGVGAGRGDL